MSKVLWVASAIAILASFSQLAYGQENQSQNQTAADEQEQLQLQQLLDELKENFSTSHRGR
jgi:hypothetical protein